MDLHGYPLAFLHIPKTAGGTLNVVLSRHYAAEEIFRFTSEPSYRHHIDRLRGLGQSRLKDYRIIFGHFSFKIAEFLPPEVVFATFLRDPIERILSYYAYAASTPRHFLHEKINNDGLTLLDCYREQLSVELDNGQTRLLAGVDHHDDVTGDSLFSIPFGACDTSLLEKAKSNLSKRFCAVGIQEYFEASLWLFRKLFDWDLQHISFRNVSRNKLKQEEVDEETLTTLQHYNRYDTELYRHAKEIFFKLLDDNGGTDYCDVHDAMSCLNNAFAKEIYAGAASRKDEEIQHLRSVIRKLQSSREA